MQFHKTLKGLVKCIYLLYQVRFLAKAAQGLGLWEETFIQGNFTGTGAIV